MKSIRDTCRVDSDRIIKAESQLRNLTYIMEKLETIDMQVQILTPLELKMMETRGFIERYLPTMIHLQLVEALHVNALNNPAKLKEFEKNKLSELQAYAQQNEGKDTFIQKLKYRLREFTAEQLEQGLGVAPFVYGKGKDYWPEMDEQRIAIDRKTKYLQERSALEEETAVNSKA